MFFFVFVFAFGAIIGSFLNVLIYRLPLGINWVYKRSFCPLCNNEIPLFRNIPIMTFIFQHGKCHQCKNSISFQYPLIEIISGIAALYLFPSVFTINSLINYFFLLSVFYSFLVHFIIDIKHHILPDEVNIYLALLFLVYGVLNFPIVNVICGGLFGFFLPYLVAYLFYKLKGIEGLGGGDIKLFGALGFYLGLKGIMLNIFYSCLLGSVIGVFLILTKVQDKNKPIAFGPFIITTAFLQIFFPDFVLKVTKMVGLLL